MSAVIGILVAAGLFMLFVAMQARFAPGQGAPQCGGPDPDGRCQCSGGPGSEAPRCERRVNDDAGGLRSEG